MMSKSNIRLFYKNQFELGHAIKSYIDNYFNNEVDQEDFESNLVRIIDSNKDKFFKDMDIAKKPKQILGKTRVEVVNKILKERSDFYEKDSRVK